MCSPQMEIQLLTEKNWFWYLDKELSSLEASVCVLRGGKRGEDMHTINNLIFMFSEKQNKAPKFIENSSYDLFHILKLHVS